MGSIFDDFELNKENLEGCIAVGMAKKDIQVAFRKTRGELDEFVMLEYGIANFDMYYDIVKQMTYKQFMDTVANLGMRGNPSALNIINNAITQAGNEKTVKIVFEGNIPEETEEDRNNE